MVASSQHTNLTEQDVFANTSMSTPLPTPIVSSMKSNHGLELLSITEHEEECKKLQPSPSSSFWRRHLPWQISIGFNLQGDGYPGTLSNGVKHTAEIVDIEPSTKEDGKKLVQAREGFQKAKEKIMLIQGPIEKTEKAEAMLVREKEELMVLLKLIQEELRSTRLKLQEL
ncbi:hypothetical protein JHK86_052398 [Glycine max]|nr:hypothetical protein JHK86_052398 [Glycine max]